VGQFLFSLFGPCSAILMMQGKQKTTALILFFNVFLDAILYYVFIQFYGLEGAIWATFATSIIYNIGMRLLVKKHLSLDPKIS